MKVSTISKRLIKPSTPTPQNLKNYYLSFMDQSLPPINISVVLFYESKPEKTSQLEESLANTLVHFYPLAGRYIKNHDLIDCSDQGALFVEAEALEAELTEDLAVKIHKLKNLFPDQDFQFDAPNPLLSIQVTHFPSDRLAIAIAVSHVVFDMSSLGMFISAWSNATNPNGKMAFAPSFHLLSSLPHKNRSSNSSETIIEDGNIVVKRFIFDKVALASIRSKLRPNTISRVRVVCAVIAKALISLDCAKHGRSRDFAIMQAINLRERTIAPRPKNACGNMAIPSLTRRVAASEAKEIGLQELVDLMGDAIGKSIADHEEIFCPDRDGAGIVANSWENYFKHMFIPEMNFLCFSDWSKFGFYEADFGWGKPVCVSVRPPASNNLTILTSNKAGDGIEAWVHLNEDDMNYFEQDEEINSLAT